jgi:RNA polymerase sigma factor (sigma-70 family)
MGLLTMVGIDPDANIIVSSLSVPTEFGEIFDRHVRDVARFIARNSHPNDVEDLVAEVFSTAFSIRARFDTTKPSARPWLFGIANNVLRHHYRRIARVRLFPLSDTAGLVRQLAIIGIEQIDADSAIEASMLKPEISQALAKLRPSRREPLMLHAVGDLSYGEIAEALGIPIGTVRSRIFRARQELRDLLGPLMARTDLEL